MVLVGLVNECLRLNVRVEIVRHEVVVTVVFNGTNKSTEVACITKGTRLDSIKNFDEFGVKSVCAVCVCMAEILNIFGQITKEEDVVLSNFTGDFNLR